MTLLFTQGHNYVSNLTSQVFNLYYNSHISDSMAFKFGMAIDLSIIWHIIYAHARFDDLDLDARSQWVGKRKKSPWNYIDN